MMVIIAVSIAVKIVIVKIAPQSASAWKLDQKYRVAVHRARIDGAVKRDRDPWLKAEAVKLVEQRNVEAIGRIGGAVRERQVDAQPGVLMAIQNGKTIAG